MRTSRSSRAAPRRIRSASKARWLRANAALASGIRSREYAGIGHDPQRLTLLNKGPGLPGRGQRVRAQNSLHEPNWTDLCPCIAPHPVEDGLQIFGVMRTCYGKSCAVPPALKSGNSFVRAFALAADPGGTFAVARMQPVPGGADRCSRGGPSEGRLSLPAASRLRRRGRAWLGHLGLCAFGGCCTAGGRGWRRPVGSWRGRRADWGATR